MKRVHAAFALLFQLLLLQASVLGGGMACAPEWMGAVSASRDAVSGGTVAHASGTQVGAAAHGGHGGHAAHAAHGRARAASADPVTGNPAHAPVPGHGGMPTHCATVAGCAAVAVGAPELTLTTVTAIHDSVQVGRVLLPPSTHLAPEPPPPRA